MTDENEVWMKVMVEATVVQKLEAERDALRKALRWALERESPVRYSFADGLYRCIYCAACGATSKVVEDDPKAHGANCPYGVALGLLEEEKP